MIFPYDFALWRWSWKNISCLIFKRSNGLSQNVPLSGVVSLIALLVMSDEETGLEIHKISRPPGFNMERRRSRAVLYQLSGHLQKQEKTKSKLKINNVRPSSSFYVINISFTKGYIKAPLPWLFTQTSCRGSPVQVPPGLENELFSQFTWNGVWSELPTLVSMFILLFQWLKVILLNKVTAKMWQ